MMGQCRFINGNKCPTPVRGADNGGEAVPVWAQEVHNTFVHLLLSFVVNLKLL